MNTEDPLILYVLMRTDLPDYQAGKSMAQANHAGTRFMRDMAKLSADHLRLLRSYNEWLQQADGFGTCIVLGVTRAELHQRLATGAGSVERISGLIHDPTYPIRDGNQVLTLPIDTCGYVFGRKSACYWATTGLHLFRD
jgi:hypothetical protein